MNHKCINCSEMTESNPCHACGYEDPGLKEMEAHITARKEAEQEADNRMVSLHLAAFELYELQALLAAASKSPIRDVICDKVGLLVESLQ